ncbi:hypothetical protein [Sandaracinus amylolyticus]|uniref:Uncharacterized protein n=1 Tax=Sandaracinus amylolyticus TaxID=927083 RepID=A0A0F6W902_9BACT|nr:hypothetical protein [Sandaracinus amylolyticus]AKF10531.1 Hypothetical protein DB32_007680 [Sandaracinus amylolyticus]
MLAGAVGCGGDDDTGGGPGPEGPLYAVMYEVYDDVGSTSYLSLLDSLDIEEIDTTRTREYGGGRAFIQAYNGWLFVGEAQSPTVIRYSVDDDGELVEEGRVSFSNYGLESAVLDDWAITWLSPTKAYLVNFADGRTIIWNPTTMEITGEIEPAEEFLREGLSLEGAPAAVRGNLLFRTFNWVNYDTAEYSTDFLLAIYDTDSDELIELVTETRCPVPGNLVHQDEAGNIYFSNWLWPLAGTIMRDAPESCVLRIAPGETRFDPEWTLDYADVTDGHHGAMFTYVGDGEALASAFYDERTSFDETTNPWSYLSTLNWRIWRFDIDDPSTAAPLEGLDFNGGAFTPVQFDDRLLLMVPGGEAEGYATQIYEVEGNQATPRVRLPGWSYQFVKLR